jgi:hypothetical protein
MNVTEFGNYPNRSARGTHSRRAESYTDTITQTFRRGRHDTRQITISLAGDGVR